MKPQNRPSIFWVGITLLLIPGLVHAYLLMPFPGSQDLNAITVCYYLEKIVLPMRIAGGILIIWYLIKYFSINSLTAKIVKLLVLVLCLGSFYYTDFVYKAETMFREPQTIKFSKSIYNKVPGNFIVIGLVRNGVAKAYPLNYIGYHHKVEDSIGGEPILVTYCTMCRTGRVYSPVIDGVQQNFRLVGARHYNAIIEDESTKTWWYQATGIAAVGKLKGERLKELPYEQATLDVWISRHPGTLILQPDSRFVSDYDDLKNYDRLQAVDKDTTLLNKDSLVRKSWIVGLIINGQPKAYDWRRLDQKRVVNDHIGETPLLVTIEADSLTFHAFNRMINGKALHFAIDTAGKITDQETASVWDWDGLATSGTLKGQHLGKIQAYQEYWHSWKHFHPNTLFWKE